MMRPCTHLDLDTIDSIINEAAQAYKGFIPADCFHEPYMSRAELLDEISRGVKFYGHEDAGELVGVMGTQRVLDATLIRHAYVRRAHQGKGIGTALLTALTTQVEGPLFVGTWAAAEWAIRLYERHGFQMVGTEEQNRLLDRYWNVSPRQKGTSVVLAYPLSGKV